MTGEGVVLKSNSFFEPQNFILIISLGKLIPVSLKRERPAAKIKFCLDFLK